MKNNQILDIAHLLMSAFITNKDVVVDATMGNGYDTLFLSQKAGFVYAFDIQQIAIDNTSALLLKNNIENVKLILDSHENIYNYLDDFKAVIFNLGYLPNGNKLLTTKTETTLKTIDLLLKKMRQNQLIFCMVYPGHPEGYKESLALDNYLVELDSNNFKVIKTQLINQKNNPPYMLLIEKIK